MEVIQDRADTKEEEFPDEFQCCVCLDIMYKPVVLACGHISCFWCTFKAMDSFLGSRCPVCRDPYNHFPRICGLLHFLLLKLYPSAYETRAQQVAEEEKSDGCESPQFDYSFVEELNTDIVQITSHEDKTTNEPTSSSQTFPNEATVKSTRKLLVTDLQCAVCKQLLYRPVVLNCGHVYCESCIRPDDSIYRCPVCRSAHPKGNPNVCLILHHFLEGYFPKEYLARKESLAHCQSHTPSGSSTAKQEQTAKVSSSPSGHRGNFHPGVGCDCCGMCPIIGVRYKCKDCVERIGFDLCENCHKSSSKLPGRFNQQHTKDHQFEVIQPSHLRMVLSSLGAELSAEEEETGGSENDGIA